MELSIFVWKHYKEDTHGIVLSIVHLYDKFNVDVLFSIINRGV